MDRKQPHIQLKHLQPRGKETRRHRRGRGVKRERTDGAEKSAAKKEKEPACGNRNGDEHMKQQQRGKHAKAEEMELVAGAVCSDNNEALTAIMEETRKNVQAATAVFCCSPKTALVARPHTTWQRHRRSVCHNAFVLLKLYRMPLDLQIFGCGRHYILPWVAPAEADDGRKETHLSHNQILEHQR